MSSRAASTPSQFATLGISRAAAAARAAAPAPPSQPGGDGGNGLRLPGSIRIPAAVCGIVGIKPTYDLVSRSGVAALSWTLDHVGPLARSVEDAALVLGVMIGAGRGVDQSVWPIPATDLTQDSRGRHPSRTPCCPGFSRRCGRRSTTPVRCSRRRRGARECLDTELEETLAIEFAIVMAESGFVLRSRAS